MRAGGRTQECEEGHTALHYASREGQEDIVRQLVKAGADVNAACYFTGGTPMHEAALKNQCASAPTSPTDCGVLVE
jgi:hypothetical protein